MQLELASLFLLFLCIYLQNITLLKISLFHDVSGRKQLRAVSPLHEIISKEPYKRKKATPTNADATTNSREDRNFSTILSKDCKENQTDDTCAPETACPCDGKAFKSRFCIIQRLLDFIKQEFHWKLREVMKS